MDWIKIWRKTCRNRYFELQVAEAVKSKAIYSPTYLSVGQEHIAAIVSEICKGWLVFPQHRCHSWYLSFTDDAEGLANELLGRKSGCNGGMAGSASVSSKTHNFFGHSGLLGDQIPIATGAAHASNKPTLCILGDAAAEEDYALGAFGYAVTKKAPILFLCEDNNRSILTPKAVRRSWDVTQVTRAMGMESIEIKDSIDAIEFWVGRLTHMLPAFININTQRHLWHAGAGCDGPPMWDTFSDFKRELSLLVGSSTIRAIEITQQYEMEDLWQRLLKQ